MDNEVLLLIKKHFDKFFEQAKQNDKKRLNLHWFSRFRLFQLTLP